MRVRSPEPDEPMTGVPRPALRDNNHRKRSIMRFLIRFQPLVLFVFAACLLPGALFGQRPHKALPDGLPQRRNIHTLQKGTKSLCPRLAAITARYPMLSERLEPQLLLAWEMASRGHVREATDKLAARIAAVSGHEQDIELIIAYAPAALCDELVLALKKNGSTVIRADSYTIKVALPLERLDAVAMLPGVTFIRTVRPPRLKNTIITEGVSLTLANTWHAEGHRGAGVKIAIADSGWANLDTLISQDEVPSSAILVNYTGSPMTDGSSNHGSACAEVIYDMAPEAELHLIKISDPTDLIAVKNYCVDNDISIVSCSLGWDALNFHDGVAYNNFYTTEANHPVTAVNLAENNGILWINAAGNEQYRHARIDWLDDGYGLLKWDDDWSWNALWLDGSTTIPAGTWLHVFLTWNQWPTTDQDFDLILYRNRGDAWELVPMEAFEPGYHGLNLQDGSPTSYPEEEIIYQVTESAQYAVEVYKYDATTSPTFILRYYGADEPTFFSYNNWSEPVPGSLAIPGDAASAFTVGALNHETYTSGPIEWYSSLGPNNRAYTGGSAVMKPDICGPSRTASSSYPGGFVGTSASTPHIAGLAALVKGAYGEYTPAQIRDYLESNAQDLGIPGKNNTYGAGAALLGSAPAPDLPPHGEIWMHCLSMEMEGNVTLKWNSEPDQTYSIFHSGNLEDGFLLLQGGIPATPPMNTYTDNIEGISVRFWKIIVDE